MGFSCIIKAPDAFNGAPMILEQWLKPLGGWMDRGDAVFSLRSGDDVVTFVSSMPGVLYEQSIPAGGEVVPDQPIGKAEVDGDEIPYGRPYMSKEP